VALAAGGALWEKAASNEQVVQGRRGEERRDARHVIAVDNLARDARYALRRIRRAPAFAVGVWSNSTIRTLSDLLMLRCDTDSGAFAAGRIHWRTIVVNRELAARNQYARTFDVFKGKRENGHRASRALLTTP
jgi:hypothetical protein